MEYHVCQAFGSPFNAIWGLRMKKNTILLLTFCLPILAFGQIYSEQKPSIFPVWHRIADFSPKMRSVESAELSPDGSLGVSGSKFGYKVMLWQVADGKLLWENEHDSEVECVVFSPDGQRIASGGEDFYVRIWDVKTGKQLAAWEHDSGLDGIAWSHDGKTIATGSEAGEAYLWHGDTYKLKGKVKAGSTINSLAFSKDDQKLVVGGNIQYPHKTSGQTVYDGFASTIDIPTMSISKTFKGPVGSVKSVRISQNEQYIATGGFDSTAYLFDFNTGALIYAFKQKMKVEAIAFTPDNNFFLVGGHELSIKVYRLSDKQLVLEIPSPRTEYLDISKDGRLLLTSHEDSGLLSLYMFLSDTQHKGYYHQMADEQLNNRDLKKQ